MRSEKHKGYMLWGHAILNQQEIPQTERYAASGTITKDNRIVEASGVLGGFETEEEAERAGIGWALAWVDGLD
ncbi:hypothetical protein [Paraburkholderia sp. BL10I2N1]|uniref:hypothetical protein n=1 Tax=Paraburkholderia sp. BL10I2N1 TaxID=1938796 RepID=UPI001061F3F6|nr:hypothetical protein [Paraburkholderia sp. BL10I2N1]TDN59118.1 hypothetical protein B0G77_8309 [Paraburkholderia sp. BL10I2N1]